MNQPSSDSHQFTILVVDDEPGHVEMVAKILRKKYHVLTADSGRTALEIVNQNAVDLALVDYRMPGISGNDFLEQLAAIAPQCLRYLVTGDSDRSTIQDAINRARIYRFVAKPVSYASLLEDIRLGLAHRSAEQAAAQADRLAMAGLTASIAAHDIRNGLQGLAMVPIYLQLGTPTDLEAATKTLGFAQRTFQACVDEILAVSKGNRPSYKMTPCSLPSLLNEVARFETLTLRGRTLTLAIDPDLPTLMLSEVHCRRVLGNLLRNAAEATPEGGNIELRTCLDPTGFAGFQVADNGPGIPAEVQRRMFESFNSSKGAHGSGFGLKMCKDVMDAHQGRLEFATSTSGTVFTALFPLPKPL